MDRNLVITKGASEREFSSSLQLILLHLVARDARVTLETANAKVSLLFLSSPAIAVTVFLRRFRLWLCIFA